ncbi:MULTISPECIES: glycosyltransferase family 4 protein [unclassified Micromonospora]|uniref:glycosyltransferase family 4 protein n=1 Tax=unclassified Micromonospora TaxID=2617518 RepID=UPI003626EFE5
MRRSGEDTQAAPGDPQDNAEGVGPLRIVVLVKTNQGGLFILPQVDELRARRHEVSAILPPGTGALTTELRRRGVIVYESPVDFTLRPSMLAGLLRLRGLIRRLRPDVLQYHLISSAYVARIATLGLPLRRVHMVAGPAYLDSPPIRTAERLLWRLDDRIICGCHYASRRYGDLGCPSPRRAVATYGVNTDDFAPRAWDGDDRAKARAELGIPQDAFLAVMVAYVYPPKRLVHRGRGVKGHDTLLRAWQVFTATHPRAHLLIVGGSTGPAGERYRRRLIDQFRVEADPTITWLDTVADVRPCYHAADVSVSPSLGESHGAAVQAGAMGVPSIVSDAGGLPETVDERSGWVAPRDHQTALVSALAQAYRESEEGVLAARGAAARSRMVDLFDNRRAAEHVADLLEQVAAGASAR